MHERCGTRDSPKLRARVPEVLHLAVKIHAARNRRSIADIVADALDAFLPPEAKRDARKAMRDAG
jgi:hypothetical protein